MNKEDFKITFDLATNFDPELIEAISKYKNAITWVFGKLPYDVIGGGRTNIILPGVSWKDLKDYVDLCHKHQIKFNYLLNALCMGNNEYRRQYHKKILKLLDRLSQFGVDGVTVSSPYLCELIKKQFPHLKISVSIHCHVRTLQEIRYWTELGADELTLFHTINRDFSTFRKFLQFTKDTGVRLRIIANNACLHECPFQSNHAAYQAHSSRTKKFGSNINIDYHILSCNNMKVKDPSKLITSDWIRPEDVHCYEKVCEETGNYNFSLKLTERTRTTGFLLRVANAYMARSFDGNLLTIINYVGNRDLIGLRKFPIYLAGILDLYNFKEVVKIKDVSLPPLLYVDNKKLDGFIDKFLNDYDCDSKVCDGSKELDAIDRKGKSQGQLCSYCKIWAEKAISCDEKERQEWVKKSDDFLNNLKESKLFRWIN